MTSERLAKHIAKAGICSRRDAERLITDGRVRVNGLIITSPAVNVTAEDNVEVNNHSISALNKTRLWLYHKPAGLLVTHKDPKGRPTIFDQLPKSLPRVISVGRLDMTSEGLLLLTNSGKLARILELPSTGLPRIYRVRVFGVPAPSQLKTLQKGLTINGIHYGSVTAHITKKTKSNCWLEVALHEGKNREIRKLFDHFGHPVSRLIRIAYGPFALGNLKQNQLKELPAKTFAKLLKAHNINVENI